MFFVYVLWSSKLKKRYIGSTSNVRDRVSDHNKGKSRFTKGGIPWILIHHEEFPDLTGARGRELFLKSGIGRMWLDEKFPEFKQSK